MSIKTKPLKITSEAKHTPGPCSYDGFGINGPDEYKTRIATFSQHANRKELNDVYGPLFAVAPDLKRECDLAADALDWTIDQLQDNVPLAPWALGLIDGLMARMKSLEAVLARAEGKGE